MRGGARSCAGRREKGASEPVKHYRDTSEQVKCYREILQGNIREIQVRGREYFFKKTFSLNCACFQTM